MRVERDLLGSRKLPEAALAGIHTRRAEENFPFSRPVHPELVRAYGSVKLACARVNGAIGALDPAIAEAIARAADEMARGELDRWVRVDALQGGAGTSTNLCVNEVLANRALVLLGKKPGEYGLVHPLDHVNLHQSTNDTFPTALRIAALRLFRRLEPAVVGLCEAFQGREKALADVVKVGRTEYMDAVLTTLGREMGAYADALARDRWRIAKCEERLRVVNLGGTAIGTGCLAPRAYIFAVVDALREATGLPLARAENLVDATQNQDALVEASGMLQALPSTLLKICGDLRLLASGPEAGLGEIRLPARQEGSSLMPGKVNPVIPEAVTQVSLRVLAHQHTLVTACSSGSLELNPFLPLIADCLLQSLDLLASACSVLNTHCVAGIEADRERCAAAVESSTAVLTALSPLLGHETAVEVAREAATERRSIREVVLRRGLLTEEDYRALISPEAVLRLGSAVAGTRPAGAGQGGTP